MANLLPAQIATLRTLVLAEPSLATARNNADDGAIAAWLNVPAAPAFYVWRSTVSADDMRLAIINTVAASTQLDALSASKRESLLWAISQPLAPNAGVSAALDDFCGTQNNLKAAIQAALKRTATVAEKALATGTGSSSSPAALGWEGLITAADAGLMR